MKQMSVLEGSQAERAPVSGQAAEPATNSDEITITFYANEVPSFVAAEMERLYENVYTSLARFRIYGEAGNASTYVVRKGGIAITIFLFRHEVSEIRVLNNQIRISEEDIHRFSAAVFSKFNAVTVISFCAIQTAIRTLPFPHQCCYSLEEVILELPATEEEYFSRLGKNTRASIKRYLKKIAKSLPSYNYTVYAKDDISEQYIREIIRLSAARMAAKNRAAYIDEEETRRIISLARIHGFVGVATIDGRVCSGLICYQVGCNYFLNVIAHDPQYDDYRIGKLCCYRTICECIRRNGKMFLFMGSTHKYKFDLLGVRSGFDYLAVYRSRIHFFLHGRSVIGAACRASVLRTKLWLLHAERRDGFVSRVASRLVQGLRNVKRSRFVSFTGRR